jgi:hypothetical protein
MVTKSLTTLLAACSREAVAEQLGLFDHAQKSYWLALRARLLQ